MNETFASSDPISQFSVCVGVVIIFLEGPITSVERFLSEHLWLHTVKYRLYMNIALCVQYG